MYQMLAGRRECSRELRYRNIILRTARAKCASSTCFSSGATTSSIKRNPKCGAGKRSGAGGRRTGANAERVLAASTTVRVARTTPSVCCTLISWIQKSRYYRTLQEQQSPRPLPGHIKSFSPLQVPLMETLTVDVGVGGELLDTGEGAVHSPKSG
jgi:hypothetical protein